MRRYFKSQESFFGNMTSVPVWYLLRYYPDMYGFSYFWWKIHPIKGWCASYVRIMMQSTCEDIFPLLFSIILYMQPNSSGSGVINLKQLLGIVCVSIMFSIMDWYCLGIQLCRQELILHMGLHQKLWYISTTKCHEVMGKLLWSGCTFSSFLLL